jgi:hypothetical protein
MYMWFYPVAVESEADTTVDDAVESIGLNHDAAICRSNTERDGQRTQHAVKGNVGVGASRAPERRAQWKLLVILSNDD